MLHLKGANDFWLTATDHKEDLYYDVLGNIHYGYLMAEMGFSEQAAAYASEGNGVPGGKIFAGTNDAGDLLATHRGYELQSEHPGGTVSGADIEALIYENWDPLREAEKLTEVG